MRLVVLLSLLLLAAAPARAGGDPSDGHSHGEEVGGASSSVGPGAVTTSAMTGRFEVVLTHAPVRGGQPYAGLLYLADYATNRPVEGASLTVQVLGAPGAVTVEETGEPGVYAVALAGGFPRDGRYDVSVSVRAGEASDLVLLSGLYVGPVEAPASEPAAEPSGGAGVPWAWVLAVAALGIALAAFLVRSARQRRASADPSGPEASSPADPVRPARPGPSVIEPTT